jgi:predicted Rossmann fold flavoprotein
MVNIQKTRTNFDVIVIGGGASGLMAAGRAAQKGRSTLLLEKNEILGKKLLITGGGRCNLSNYKLDNRTLIECYKDQPPQLFALLHRFNVQSTLDFFLERGLDTKLEAEDRLFPITQKAQSVQELLVKYVKEEGVHITLNSSVLKTTYIESKKEFCVQTQNNEYMSKSLIISTGGLSRPETGSTGDGFIWAKSLGHTVSEDSLSLVPIALKGQWFKELSGTPLDDVEIGVWQENKKLNKNRGRILFTHFGLTGPTILNMSSKISDALKNDRVELQIDFLPDLTDSQLKLKITDLIDKNRNKEMATILKGYLPKKMIPLVLKEIKINHKAKGHSITKEQRKIIIKALKGLSFEVKGLLGKDKAIISGGGVKISEIDFKTMESKIVPGLYFVGDTLDINRPTGGYSLQLCWSTGFVAGDNA